MRVVKLAVAACLAISSGSADAESYHQVQGADIKARFAGMEFTDEDHWALVFGRDGTLVVRNGSGGGKGTWKVEKMSSASTTGARAGAATQFGRQARTSSSGARERSLRRRAAEAGVS